MKESLFNLTPTGPASARKPRPGRPATVARLITNSTGRTSGFMAWREWQKGLGPDDHIVFANTGHESEESLLFLHKQELAGMPVHWIEWDPVTQWKYVNYFTAARYNDQATHAITPFEKVIAKRGYVPNVATRYCTEILKIRAQRDFMRSMGYSHWVKLVGLRWDEPQRYRDMKRSNQKERWNVECPLYDDRITEADVLSHWLEQPFDLRLMRHEGNCKYCFLKRETRIVELMRHEEAAEPNFYLNAEQATGTQFIQDTPYRALQHVSRTQTQLDYYPEGLLPKVSCYCDGDA